MNYILKKKKRDNNMELSMKGRKGGFTKYFVLTAVLAVSAVISWAFLSSSSDRIEQNSTSAGQPLSSNLPVSKELPDVVVSEPVQPEPEKIVASVESREPAGNSAFEVVETESVPTTDPAGVWTEVAGSESFGDVTPTIEKIDFALNTSAIQQGISPNANSIVAGPSVLSTISIADIHAIQQVVDQRHVQLLTRPIENLPEEPRPLEELAVITDSPEIKKLKQLEQQRKQSFTERLAQHPDRQKLLQLRNNRKEG